jgi:predicted membrane protein
MSGRPSYVEGVMTQSKWRISFALLLIFLGLVILLFEIFHWRIDLETVIETIWPIALIVIGGYLIWRQRRERRPGAHFHNKAFGDLDIGGSELEVDGLDASLGFGDMRIDFTQAKLAEKEHRAYARIGVGDIKVILPQGIPIHVRGTAGVGDVRVMQKSAEGLGCEVTFESEGYQEAARKIRLVIKAGIGDIAVTRTG